MSNINITQPIEYIIDQIYWSKCQICNKSLKDIKLEYGGSNCYFAEAFLNHIKSHKIELSYYFETVIGLPRPICKCGVCKQKVNIKRESSKIKWRTHKCGLYEETKVWAEKAKQSRKGSGNPMFQKTPWNFGLDITHPSVEKMASKRRGKKLSENSRKKMSESAKKRKIHGHTGHKHTEENCNKIRLRNLDLIKRGILKQTKTKPCIIFANLLDNLNIKYEEEKAVGYFSIDFYLIDYNLYIEIDGDYWHSNPIFYPNGPETKTQKINHSRDISKNNYFSKNSLKYIRFWENDILKNLDKVKEKLLCILSQ